MIQGFSGTEFAPKHDCATVYGDGGTAHIGMKCQGSSSLYSIYKSV